LEIIIKTFNQNKLNIMPKLNNKFPVLVNFPSEVYEVLKKVADSKKKSVTSVIIESVKKLKIKSK